MKSIFLLITLLISSSSIASSLDQLNIEDWGYEDSANGKYNESICLFGFSPLEKDYKSIRSVDSIQENSRIHYRYTLVKETYSSIEEADSRLEFLKNPPRSNSLVSKSCNLRKAFRVEKTVYFVHTDVGAFTDEMKSVFSLLQHAIQESNLGEPSDP